MGKAAPPFQTASSPTDPDPRGLRDLGDSPAIAEPELEAGPGATAQAQVADRRPRRQIPGGLLLVSIAIHGIVLGLPVPEPPPPLEIEPPARLDRLDAVTVESAPAPEPAPTTEPAPQPAPTSQPAPRATAPAPRAPAPAAEPATEEPAPLESPPSTAASDPPPEPTEDEAEASPDPPPDPAPVPDPPEPTESPQTIAGVPVLPGGELIASLPSSLTPARLERYRQGGSRHPDILGQYLLRVPPEESPENVFQQRYQALFAPDQFRVELHGALAGGGISAPQYRLRRLGETTSQFITLERLPAPDQDKLLITIWRRLPS